MAKAQRELVLPVVTFEKLLGQHAAKTRSFESDQGTKVSLHVSSFRRWYTAPLHILLKDYIIFKMLMSSSCVHGNKWPGILKWTPPSYEYIYCMLMWKNPKSEINVFPVSHNKSTVALMNKASGPSVCPFQVEIAADSTKEITFFY